MRAFFVWSSSGSGTSDEFSWLLLRKQEYRKRHTSDFDCFCLRWRQFSTFLTVLRYYMYILNYRRYILAGIFRSTKYSTTQMLPRAVFVRPTDAHELAFLVIDRQTVREGYRKRKVRPKRSNIIIFTHSYDDDDDDACVDRRNSSSGIDLCCVYYDG